MDGIALASVLTSGAVGLAAVGGGIWSTRSHVTQARADRIYERKTEAYLEILDIVQREGHRIYERKRQLEESIGELEESSDRSAPTDAGPLDTLRLGTLTAAFASRKLEQAILEWRRRVARFDVGDEFVAGGKNWIGHEDNLAKLLLVPKQESDARTVVIEQIAKDLGHR